MRRAPFLAALLSLAIGCAGGSPPPIPPYPGVIAPFPPPRPKAAKKLAPVAPPDRPYGSAEELSRSLDAHLASFGAEWGEPHGFHGYVLVRDRGETVYAKAWGMANREKKSSLDGDTRFRVGSLTKMFTAAAVLALEEEKKLAVDDRVRKHLPELPASWDKVTLRHLLNQSSGIPDYASRMLAERAKKHTPAQVLAVVKDLPLAFEPGARFDYSNTNYFVLGLVAEKVAGKPFAAFLAERVLDRAGMKRSSLEDAPTLPNSAVGYQLDEVDQLVPADPVDFSVPFAAGALRSTPNDLVRWHEALAGGKVLSEGAREKLFTPALGGYAMGFIRAAGEGGDLLWHSGGIDGFQSFFARLPERDACVVVLSNDGVTPTTELGLEIARAVARGKAFTPRAERKTAVLPADLAKNAPGDYALTDASRKALADAKIPEHHVEGIRGVTLRKPAKRAPKGVPSAALPQLVLKPVGQPPLPLFAAEGGALFSKVAGVEITVELDPKTKKAKGLVLRQSGLELAYAPGKAPPPAKAPPDLKAPAPKAPPPKKK